MPVEPFRIIVNGIYRTDTNQQRKVTEITADGKVRYSTRSGNTEAAWSFGSSPTLANSPTIEVFAQQCSEVIQAIDDADDKSLLKCVKQRHTIAIPNGEKLAILANGFWSTKRAKNPGCDELDIRLYTIRLNDETIDQIMTERELIDRIGQEVFDRLPS